MNQVRTPSRQAARRAATVLSGIAALAAVALATPAAAATPESCSASSGKGRTALIELYTSEGCSSCPGADRQLMDLKGAVDAGARVVPIALHVPYWDYIGWKDPYALAAFAERQRELVRANARRSVYTPQFFVSGIEARDWPMALREQVRRVNAQSAGVVIDLAAEAGQVHARVQAVEPVAAGSAELFIAVTEGGLVSQVRHGENAGVTLQHDHVVRRWLGPFPLPALAAGQRHALDAALPLQAGWLRERLALVAFVQSRPKGQVLQALQMPATCLASS